MGPLAYFCPPSGDCVSLRLHDRAALDGNPPLCAPAAKLTRSADPVALEPKIQDCQSCAARRLPHRSIRGRILKQLVLLSIHAGATGPQRMHADASAYLCLNSSGRQPGWGCHCLAYRRNDSRATSTPLRRRGMHPMAAHASGAVLLLCPPLQSCGFARRRIRDYPGAGHHDSSRSMIFVRRRSSASGR